MTDRSIEEIMNDLAVSVRNNTLDTAAKVAALYGAPNEACERILTLKGKTIPTAEQAEQLTKRAV